MLLFVVNMQDLIPRKKGKMQGREIIKGKKQRKREKGRREFFLKISWLSM
jgi:hypothetical protein